MKKITEVNRTSMSDLMCLCIKEKWFTRAFNDDYTSFLNKWDEKGHDNLTPNDIYEMSLEVMKYSDLPYGYEVQDVMFLIKREAVTTLYEIEE